MNTPGICSPLRAGSGALVILASLAGALHAEPPSNLPRGPVPTGSLGFTFVLERGQRDSVDTDPTKYETIQRVFDVEAYWTTTSHRLHFEDVNAQFLRPFRGPVVPGGMDIIYICRSGQVEVVLDSVLPRRQAVASIRSGCSTSVWDLPTHFGRLPDHPSMPRIRSATPEAVELTGEGATGFLLIERYADNMRCESKIESRANSWVVTETHGFAPHGGMYYARSCADFTTINGIPFPQTVTIAHTPLGTLGIDEPTDMQVWTLVSVFPTDLEVDAIGLEPGAIVLDERGSVQELVYTSDDALWAPRSQSGPLRQTRASSVWGGLWGSLALAAALSAIAVWIWRRK